MVSGGFGSRVIISNDEFISNLKRLICQAEDLIKDMNQGEMKKLIDALAVVMEYFQAEEIE